MPQRILPTLARRVLLAVLGTSLLGLALLWAAARLPTGPLEEHIRVAVESGGFSENYPKILLFRSLDRYTECAGINIALEMRPELVSILGMRNFQECKGLRARFTEGAAPADWPYARYWHGYQTILKPLYTWLPAACIPWVASGVALLLLAALFGVAAARLGKATAALLILSFALPGSLTVFPLLTHGVQFWWVLLSCLAVCLYRSPAMPLGLFAVMGAGAAFVCFFNMESLSLGMGLLCHCLLRRQQGQAVGATLRESLWLCVAWGAAFVGMWLVKWGLAWLVLPQGTDLLGGTVGAYAPRSPEMLGKAVLANVLRMPWTVALASFLLLGWRFWRKGLRWPHGMGALLVPALIPFLWYALMPGHVEKHSFFMPVVLWPAVAVLAVGLWGERRR